MKDKLKRLDAKAVETTSALILLVLTLLGGGIALVTGLVVPILIAAAVISGDFTEAGQYLLLGLVGFYLYRGIVPILKETRSILD